MNPCYYQKSMIKQFLRSVSGVNPAKLISENMKVEQGKLFVSHKVYDISHKNVYLVGFGKAVLGMAAQCERILGHHLKSGIICCPRHMQSRFKNNPEFSLKENSVITVHEGAENNLPDEDAEKGTDEIISLFKKLDSTKDHLIILISGGGSALLTKPKPGISLHEKMEIVKLLMEAGADIEELNIVRKKLSLVKGGGLAQLSFPVKTTCLIISDVINDPVNIIASGPTVPSDPNLAAFNVIQKYNLQDKISPNILAEIKRVFQVKDNSIIDNEFSHVSNFIIGNNRKALDASKKYAEENGFEAIVISSQVRGNVHNVSNFYSNMLFEILNAIYKNENVSEKNFFKNCCFDANHSILKKINNIIKQSNEKKICIIAGGETTVTVKGNGKGGRNQELALITSVKVNNMKTNFPYLFNKYEIMFLFAGTDGIDGPTDAAGGMGGPFIVEKAAEQNLRIDEFLSRNDSYNFYNKIDNGCYMIKTGHTGTNVMDIHTFMIYPKLSTV